jgi:hypothetical protein
MTGAPFQDLFTMHYVKKSGTVDTYRIQFTIRENGEVHSFIDKPMSHYDGTEEHREQSWKVKPEWAAEVKFGLHKSREPEFAWSVVWKSEDLYVRGKLEKALVWETKKTWNRAKPFIDWF